MAEIVRMPEVLANTTEAAVQTWLVAVGDVVERGTPLAEIETEKAVVDYAAETSGTVAAILAEEGASVVVGEPILVLRHEGDSDADVAAALGGQGARSDGSTEDAASGAAAEAEAGAPVAGAQGSERAATPQDAVAAESPDAPARRFASPIVRKLARERGVDLALVRGTGENGRIVRRDLERHLTEGATAEPAAATATATAPVFAPTPAAPAAESADDGSVVVPLTAMRRAIARRLTESKSTVPHFYLTAHCDVTELLALRRRLNEGAPRRVSVNDLVVKAVAGALVEVPESNAVWGGDCIRRFSRADVSVAVSTDGGLLTPVIRGVEDLTVGRLSERIADAAERARAGRLRQDELEGGSFSVSNLGMHGVDEFAAILNPPQSGILAVGAASERPVVVDGEVVVRSVLTVTVSWDHRVVDGAVGAQWLAAFRRRLEHPMALLL